MLAFIQLLSHVLPVVVQFFVFHSVSLFLLLTDVLL